MENNLTLQYDKDYPGAPGAQTQQHSSSNPSKLAGNAVSKDKCIDTPPMALPLTFYEKLSISSNQVANQTILRPEETQDPK